MELDSVPVYKVTHQGPEPKSQGEVVFLADHQREVFHLKSQIKKLTEDLEGYKHIAQRDSYYEAFLAWWEGRKD